VLQSAFFGATSLPRAPSCASLGPWGLAHANGRLFVSSFGSDQILVFESATGRFLDALGDPSVIDSPEGLALSPDGSTLLVASFLNSRLVAFDLSELYGSGDDTSAPPPLSPAPAGRIVSCGHPVDLDYLVRDADPDHEGSGCSSSGGGDGDGGGSSGSRATPVVDWDYAAGGGGDCISMLHGPEDVVFLPKDPRGVDLIAVTSYYNASVIIVNARSGALVEVVTVPLGGLDGPMGLAVDEDCGYFGSGDDFNPDMDGTSHGPCLLVTNYKSRAPGRVSRIMRSFGDVSSLASGEWQFAGHALVSNALRGASCVLPLPSGDGALACSYDSSAVLVFNATEAALNRKAVLSVAGAQAASSGNWRPSGAPRTSQHGGKRRKLGGEGA